MIAAAAPAALAQAIPSPVLPGRIERELQPPQEAPPALAPLLPPLAPEAPETAPSGIEFELKDVTFEGETVYTPAQIRAAVASFIGKTMTVENLPQLEEAITVMYRRDGYILSRAVVDAQTIDPQQGIVHLKIYEGYINEVRLDPLDYEVGEKGALVKSILKKIAHACRDGDKPVGDKPCPLHRDTLERYLLLANDVPGVKVSAVIQPSSDAEGGADLFVTIEEHLFEFTGGIDNRGSSYVGPMSLHQSAAFNNLLGFYDRTEFHATQSIPINELFLINGVEEVPLTSEGLRAAMDFTFSRTRPGDVLRPLNLTTISNAGGLSFSYPLIRTRSANLQARAGFELRNSETTQGLADATAFFDRTRVLTVGLSYDLADSWLGVNLADLSIGQGIPLLGATPERSQTSSHPGASPSFTKFTGQISRVQQIFPEWNLLGAASGQYSFSKLLSSEQFGYGGEQYGRAFDPSEILGDRGIEFKAEVQYTPAWGPAAMSWLPRLFDWPDTTRSLQLYGFYDIGRVWVDPGPSQQLSGASTGAGMRYTLSETLAGYIEVGFPLTRGVASERAKGQSGKAPRVFFSIATKF